MTRQISESAPPVGVAEIIAPGLRRILAPNPSPMTFWGTNTYLLGQEQVAVIDPGPKNDAHLQTILEATDHGRTISHIMVTHAHMDHSPLAADLSQYSGARIFAFGTAVDGRSEIMTQLAETGLAGGGEGIDHAFTPDHALHHGEKVHSDEWQLEALHTPGHIGNHLCFAWGEHCFTGDHVMGWASSLVSPPDGDLTDFMASCRLLQTRQWHMFFPGHGAPVETANDRLDWLVAHRLKRESAVLAHLENGPAQAFDIAQAIYHDTPASLMGAATRNVFAHLIDLTRRGLIEPRQTLEAEALFSKK